MQNNNIETDSPTGQPLPDSTHAFRSYADAARYWCEFGLTVIPVVPNDKRTVTKWDPWLKDLSPAKVAAHWRVHPEHELGCIVGDDQLVLDADSPQAVAALTTIEMQFGLTASLIVRTKKGVHHYFRRAKGTDAKSDSHCTELHPERLDVKTGRNMVILAPSTEKTIQRCTATSRDDLTEASQAFIDAVCKHNGRALNQPPVILPCATSERPQVSLGYLKALLRPLDPDMGYNDWLIVLMAIFYSTQGSDDGLELANCWSRAGAKYKNFGDIEKRWRSFRLDHPRPVKLGTLIMMARNAGADIAAIVHDDELVGEEA